MKFSKNEIIFLSIIALGTLLFSYFLYVDVTRKTRSGKNKVIGSITFKRKSVQRKYANTVIWEDLEEKVPLRNKDSIRTAELSDAEITLNNGTKIQLDENSMIVLNTDEGKTDIDFAYGTVQAKSAETNSGINIKSGDKSISLANGDVKLSKSNEGNNGFSVFVQRGLAKLFFGNKTQEIQKDEKAVISNNNDVKVNKVELKLISPSDQNRFFIKDASRNVQFVFEKGGADKSTTLEISEDYSFKKIIFQENTKSNSITKLLMEGIYYWRIKSGKEVSDVYKFGIFQNKPVKNFYPTQNIVIEYYDEYPLVNFSWSKNEITTDFLIEIARDRFFKNIYQSSNSTVDNISLRIQPGNYYWRVHSRDPSSQDVVSAIETFSVKKSAELNEIILLNPVPNKEIYSILAEKKGVLFNWSGDERYKSYKIILSKDLNFSDIVLKKVLTDTTYLLNEKLSQGTYYWKIEGTPKFGKKTKDSKSYLFKINSQNTIQLLIPKDNESFNEEEISHSQGLTFSWENLPITSNYKLIIAKDKNFANPIKQVVAKEFSNSITLSDLTEGAYYWKIIVSDKDNKQLLSSKINSFLIKNKIEEPTIFQPSNQANFDITAIKEIEFSWKQIKNLEYYIFEIKKQDKSIYSKKLKSSLFAFNEFNLLDEGSYDWTVFAKNSFGESSSKSIGRFKINKNKQATELLQKKEKAAEKEKAEKEKMKKEQDKKDIEKKKKEEEKMKKAKKETKKENDKIKKELNDIEILSDQDQYEE